MDCLNGKNGNFNIFTFVLLGNCAELNDNLSGRSPEMKNEELRMKNSFGIQQTAVTDSPPPGRRGGTK